MTRALLLLHLSLSLSPVVLLGCRESGPCDPDKFTAHCEGEVRVWCGRSRGELLPAIRRESCEPPLGRCTLYQEAPVCSPSMPTCDPATAERSCVDGQTLRGCFEQRGDDYGHEYMFVGDRPCEDPLPRCVADQRGASCRPAEDAIACDPATFEPTCTGSRGQHCVTGFTGDPTAPEASYLTGLDCERGGSLDAADDRSCAVVRRPDLAAPALQCVLRIEACDLQVEQCINGIRRGCIELGDGATALVTIGGSC